VVVFECSSLEVAESFLITRVWGNAEADFGREADWVTCFEGAGKG
jgi:hypothetical protein